jgi:hypothetical protein
MESRLGNHPRSLAMPLFMSSLNDGTWSLPITRFNSLVISFRLLTIIFRLMICVDCDGSEEDGFEGDTGATSDHESNVEFRRLFYSLLP